VKVLSILVSYGVVTKKKKKKLNFVNSIHFTVFAHFSGSFVPVTLLFTLTIVFRVDNFTLVFNGVKCKLSKWRNVFWTVLSLFTLRKINGHISYENQLGENPKFKMSVLNLNGKKNAYIYIYVCLYHVGLRPFPETSKHHR